MSMSDTCEAAVPPAAREAGEGVNEAAEEVASRLGALADAGTPDAISDEALQALMSAAIAIYAAKADQRGALFPLSQHDRTNATAVLMATTALLKGSSIELFELGMWQTWSGMK